jgi:hypothetical protein
MRIPLLIFFLLSATLTHAQIKFGDFRLSGTVNQVSFSDLPTYTVAGVRGELMLGKVFGTEFGFSGGPDYFDVGLGILSPLALLLAGTGSDNGDGSLGGLVLFLACAASFVEHTNYHIRITDSFEVVPFLSLARFRYHVRSHQSLLPPTSFYRGRWERNSA